jgi:AcrR family transcriptional regulator
LIRCLTQHKHGVAHHHWWLGRVQDDDCLRRETRQRIAEVGQRLFLTRGYEGTTLDVIAAEADISRRAFFSYFKSKDDIIFFWLEADRASLIASLLTTSPDV